MVVNVAFIGLGNMGSSMAARSLQTGFRLTRL
jgi:3-hydroxyisobutyrate dehydrogenase-like beta-hydroxyacid dehydrogenase